MTRVVFFVDYQNCYQDARRAFYLPPDARMKGQISPRRYAEVVSAARGRPDWDLRQVRLYTGRPSAKDARTYAAHMRQCAAWEKERDVVIVARTLRYPRDWPSHPAQEKGIDVQLAVDLVRGYVANEFDIGVVATTDTDLIPAIEAVFDLDRKAGYDPVEVCAWKTATYRKQLRVDKRSIWCNELTIAHYARAADFTDYNIKT